MRISDILITDYSGVSCEFMYFDKPIVIADPNFLPVGSQKKPGVWNVCTVCENPSNLLRIITKQLQCDEKRGERNHYFKNLVYQEEGSTATDRGIQAIIELLQRKV